MIPADLLPADLQTNESLGKFDSVEALARDHIAMSGRVSSGAIDLLPEDLRKDPTIGNYKTLPDLAKGLIETKKLVGTIKRPPETPDGYKFTEVKNLHAGVKISPEFDKALAQLAHKAGAPAETADAMRQGFLEIMSASMAQREKQTLEETQKNETALRSKWGAEFDNKYNRVDRVLGQIAGKLGTDGEAFKGAFAKLGNNPTVLEGLDHLVGLLSEDGIKSLGGVSATVATDKKTALTRINQIMEEVKTQGAKHPFVDDKNPDNKKIREEWTNLHKLAYGVSV